MRYLLLALLATVSAAQAQQYSVTILQSPQSWGYGVSGGHQVGAFDAQHGSTHAMVWDGTYGNGVDLHVSSFMSTYCAGISGPAQVGYGLFDASGNYHALLWSGSADSCIDLNPGLISSHATAISGNSQVGFGYGGASGREHALLWSGTANSCVDLDPGFLGSRAYGVDGNTQGGTVTFADGTVHAYIWSGTPESAVDINPSGSSNSYVFGISGNYQVGTAVTNHSHAILWTGTAASAIDLNPSGFDSSFALGVAGNTQVGYGNGTATAFSSHALLWNGTAASHLDLHPYLTGVSLNGTPVTLIESYAQGVDSEGHIAGYGVDASQNKYALLWSPVRSISGTVTLQNYISFAVQGTLVTVELRAPGTTIPLDSHTVGLDSNGGYSFATSLPAGTYDIAIKSSHWLRKVLASQSVGLFGKSGVSVSLTNGDINGDNRINLADFALLRAAFGSAVGDSNYNQNADLNGNGEVNLSDFAVLRTNFGKQGDN